MYDNMRWVEFTTNCRCREGRFRLNEIVRLPADRAIVLISCGHCIARHDLDTDSQRNTQTPAVKVESEPIETPVVAVEDSKPEPKEPQRYIDLSKEKMLKPDNKMIHTAHNKKVESRIREDWLSMGEALELLGLKDTSGNRTMMRSLVDKHKIRGEIREGLRPAYQFDKISLQYYKAEQDEKAKAKGREK